jgi:hypothetical protein
LYINELMLLWQQACRKTSVLVLANSGSLK